MTHGQLSCHKIVHILPWFCQLIFFNKSKHYSPFSTSYDVHPSSRSSMSPTVRATEYPPYSASNNVQPSIKYRHCVHLHTVTATFNTMIADLQCETIEIETTVPLQCQSQSPQPTNQHPTMKNTHIYVLQICTL